MSYLEMEEDKKNKEREKYFLELGGSEAEAEEAMRELYSLFRQLGKDECEDLMRHDIFHSGAGDILLDPGAKKKKKSNVGDQEEYDRKVVAQEAFDQTIKEIVRVSNFLREMNPSADFDTPELDHQGVMALVKKPYFQELFKRVNREKTEKVMMEKEALQELFKNHRFALTKTSQNAVLSLDFDEDEHELSLKRYAEQTFPRVAKGMSTWSELKELDVISRVHPLYEGEHDDYLKEKIANWKDLRQCYTWDYCLVFKKGEDDKLVTVTTREQPPGGAGKTIKTTERLKESVHFQNETARIIGALNCADLKVSVYLSVQRDEIYCLVGASEARIIQQAEQMEMELELDKKVLMDRAARPPYELNFTKHPEIGPDVWENIFAPFKDFKQFKDNRFEFYQQFEEEGMLHPQTNFRTVDRLKLTAAIISDELVLGGAGLPISKFIGNKKHPLLSFYPLDEMIEKEELKKTTYPIRNFWNPKLDEIRDYFGEQIAMYFAFLASYTRWLMVPAVVGSGFAVWQGVAGTVDVPGISAFGVLVALWSTLFLENWRHTEARLRSRWGQHNATTKSANRAEFDGDWVVSRVTGEVEESHLTHKRLRRAIASNMALVLFLCVILASVGSVFFVRKTFQTAVSFAWSMNLTALVNTFQIQIMNFLYGKISKGLNDFENHQTDNQYFNAMIVKTYIVKFVNCYNTFFYIGVFKRYDKSTGYCMGSFAQHFNRAPLAEQSVINGFVHGTNTTSAAAAGLSPNGLAAVNTLVHGPDYRGDCMHELSHNLLVIFLVSIFVSNFIEVFIPWLHSFLKNRKETKSKPGEDKVVLSEPERQYLLDEYESTFGDYEELVVQFGYVCLFVVACPATPMFALINNIIEYRIDATKLVGLVRRPIPRSAGDIGTWYSVLALVSWLCLVTNLYLIMFASSLTRGKSAAFILLGFIAAEHVLFFLKLFIGMIYKGDPASVKEHVARQEFLVGKLIGR